jgi:hypothetical protein
MSVIGHWVAVASLDCFFHHFAVAVNKSSITQVGQANLLNQSPCAA